jgi:hypothetical protein
MTSEVLISSGLCCPLSTNAHKAERKTGTVRGRAKVRKGKSRIIEKESNPPKADSPFFIFAAEDTPLRSGSYAGQAENFSH